MDESAIKGLKSLEWNDRDADIQKQPRSVSMISVEGYDTTWRQAYLLKLEVEKHFASRGNIIYTYFPVDYERCILMRIEGEGAAEKALELNGTDVGGWTAIVKSPPGHNVSMEDRPSKYRERIRVRGYDTSLPEIDIMMALCKHFSSCGEIWNIMVLPYGSAFIYLEGETCVSKALELNGSNVGGRTLAVAHDVPRRKTSFRKPTGYMPPSYYLELAEKKKKMKMEMENEKEMKDGEEDEDDDGVEDGEDEDEDEDSLLGED